MELFFEHLGKPEEQVAVAISGAGAIIRQRTGVFDPNEYRDRYQEALQRLIEDKMKGRTIKAPPPPKPSPVVELMAALKSSLAQERPARKRAIPVAKKANKDVPNRRQPALLLPVSGGRTRRGDAAAQSATPGTKRRKRA